MPQLGRLLAVFQPWRLGLGHRPSDVVFAVDKVTLGHVYSEYFDVPCQF
jgi:hypothetical protein